MTPPRSFVKDLAAYDPALRVRWAKHMGKWLIERKLELRNPAWLAERPLNPFGHSPRAKDLWQGWRQGYVHVLTVPRELLAWSVVAPHLAAVDREQAGSWEALIQRIEEADAKLEAERARNVVNWAEATAGEAADTIMWREGHRVATAHAPSGVASSDRVETHEGFTVRVRKGAA